MWDALGNLTLTSSHYRVMQRREWDSNPRWSYPHTRFPSVLLKPLGHLSGGSHFSRSTFRLYHRFPLAHDDDRLKDSVPADLSKTVHKACIVNFAETGRVLGEFGCGLR